jgi:serine O-acetyltransferase
MSPGRIRTELKTMRRLVSADTDLYGLWPRHYRRIRADRSRWVLFLYLFFTVHMFPAVFLYRVQVFLYDSGFPPLATFVSRLNHFLFGVTIGNHVRTSGALLIAHGHVVLDGWTRLGSNVEINPFVTLGIGNSEREEFNLWGPTIGDHVNIGTGAKVLGRVHIGDYAKIGANAVVVDDVPAHHTAVGAPARSFPTAKRQQPDAGAQLDPATDPGP